MLERQAKELADRLSAMEKQSREQDKNTQVHSRWIEHLNQQVATINNTVSTVTFRVNKLEELPDRLTDLQEQFAALIRAAERDEDEEPLVARVSDKAHEAERRSSPVRDDREAEEEESPLEILTPLTRQAFFVILQMLHESGEDWLPLAQVTARLYPEREGKKIHNVVANVLRPLYQNKLLEKRRKANYVSLRPTQKGLNAGKDHFKESELKRVEKAFE